MDAPLVLAIALVALGVVLVVVGLLLRPIWRAVIRPLYRQPDAQEPSEVGWRLRTGILVLCGILVAIGGAMLASSIAGQAPTSQESTTAAAVERCDEIVDAVDRPSSLAEADAAIADAATAAGYDVAREDSETEETVPQPSGEAVVVIEQTRWTVLDGDDEVAAFTWTSGEGGVHGRLTAEECD